MRKREICEKCAFRASADPEVFEKIHIMITAAEKGVHEVWEIVGRFLEEHTGTCPNELFNWHHPKKCREICGKESGDQDHVHWRCWAVYLAEVQAPKFVAMKKERLKKEQENNG
jgi:hypothetical protein